MDRKTAELIALRKTIVEHPDDVPALLGGAEEVPGWAADEASMTPRCDLQAPGIPDGDDSAEIQTILLYINIISFNVCGVWGSKFNFKTCNLYCYYMLFDHFKFDFCC